MPLHKDIRYSLYKSKSSNSYYISFWKSNTKIVARVSDHDSPLGAKGSTVDEETTKAEIAAMFNERIKALLKKREAYIWRVHEKRRKTKIT